MFRHFFIVTLLLLSGFTTIIFAGEGLQEDEKPKKRKRPAATAPT